MASDNLVSITINDKSLRRSLRALDLAATDPSPRCAKSPEPCWRKHSLTFLMRGVRVDALAGSGRT